MSSVAVDAAPSPVVADALAPSTSQRRAERVALIGLILLYLICSTGFALVVPFGEAPDEDAHVMYIEHLVRFQRMPDITPQYYTNESFQPPLY
jgi:hypothetical protein